VAGRRWSRQVGGRVGGGETAAATSVWLYRRVIVRVRVRACSACACVRVRACVRACVRSPAQGGGGGSYAGRQAGVEGRQAEKMHSSDG